MSISFLVAVVMPAAGPMDLLNKFSGHTWFTSLEFPDKYENIVTTYRTEKGTVVGLGWAQAMGERAMALRSTYSATADANVVTFADQQGDRKHTGKVTRRGDTLLIAYDSAPGQGSFREELTFQNADRDVIGEVFSDGKMLLSYRMRRVERPPVVVLLEGKDPVEMTKGKHIAGNASITRDFEGFRYQFVSDASRRVFDSDRTRYAVQFGGACGSMGPLSGRGQPQLFEVFDNRIYLFASEGCRKSFLAEPAAYVDRPEASFRPGVESGARGAALLEESAKAHGIGSLTSVLRIENQTYKAGEKTHRYDIATWTDGHQGFVEASSWFEATFVNLVSERGSWTGGLHKPASTFVPSEQDYFRRQFFRDPLILLKNRRSKGFVADYLGVQDVADLKGFEAVKVHYRGATTTLFIDPASKLVAAVRYRGRLIRESNQVVKVFGDVREIGGTKVAFQVTTHPAGGGTPTVAKFAAIRVNVPIDLLPVRNPLAK